MLQYQRAERPPCFFIRADRSKALAILKERERISHEMHDTLAQSFAGVGYHLQGIRRTVREGDIQPTSLLTELDLACDMVIDTHRAASASIAALHPDTQRNGDILRLLQRSVQAMLNKKGMTVKLLRSGEPVMLPLATAE